MLVFGISKQGQLLTKIEQENVPVMAVLPRPTTGLKMSYRMTFNNRALQLMLRKTWTIGQDINEETGVTRNFFIDVANMPAGVVPNITFDVCNNGNVNNQKLWKHFREIFHNENSLLKYKLTTTTIDGITVLLLEEYNPEVLGNESIHLSSDSVHSEVAMPSVESQRGAATPQDVPSDAWKI